MMSCLEDLLITTDLPGLTPRDLGTGSGSINNFPWAPPTPAHLRRVSQGRVRGRGLCQENMR